MKNKKNLLNDEALYQQMLKELTPGAREYDRLLARRHHAQRRRCWPAIARYAASCVVCVICGTWAAWYYANNMSQESTTVMNLSVPRKLSPAIVQKVSLATSEAPHQLPQKAPSPQHKQTVIKVTPSKEANEVDIVKELPLEMTASTDSKSSNERQQIQEQIENALFELQLIDTVINYALTYQDINTL